MFLLKTFFLAKRTPFWQTCRKQIAENPIKTAATQQLKGSWWHFMEKLDKKNLFDNQLPFSTSLFAKRCRDSKKLWGRYKKELKNIKLSKTLLFTQNLPPDKWRAVPRILAETFKKNPKNFCIMSAKNQTKRKFFLESCSQQTPLEMAKAVFTTLVKISAEGFKKYIAESRKSTEKSLPFQNKIEYSEQSSGELEGSFKNQGNKFS